MDFKKKPFKLIPLHKAMNIEKTMRGKFVNKFSTNLNFKNANPFVNSKSEKTNINLLNPLKDFIDEISFDLNIAGNSSYGNVNINQIIYPRLSITVYNNFQLFYVDSI